jgi:hypothetical protein
MIAISLLGTLQLNFFRKDLSEKVVGLFQSDALQVFQHPEYILEPLNRPLLSEPAAALLSQSLNYSLHLVFLFMTPLLIVHLWLSSQMPNVRPHEIIPIPEIEAMGE